MEFTASSIAGFLNGKVEGNPDVVVNTVAKIEEGKSGALSFLSNPKYTKYLYSTGSSIVLINKDFVLDGAITPTLIRVDNAYESFAKLLSLVASMQNRKVGVHSQSFVEPSGKVGDNVYIGAFAYIGENSTIGDNTQIYPQVYVGDNVTIGSNTIIYVKLGRIALCMQVLLLVPMDLVLPHRPIPAIKKFRRLGM